MEQLVQFLEKNISSDCCSSVLLLPPLLFLMPLRLPPLRPPLFLLRFPFFLHPKCGVLVFGSARPFLASFIPRQPPAANLILTLLLTIPLSYCLIACHHSMSSQHVIVASHKCMS